MAPELTSIRGSFQVRALKTVNMEALRWELTQVAKHVVAGGRVVATYRGRPKFALVPLADLERLEGKPASAKPKKRSPRSP